MPQAIKHFNGTATSGSATIYTCPASTIAILLPSIVVNQSSTFKGATFAWNSSSVAADTQGNLRFYAYSDTHDLAHVSTIDKYNVLITVPDSNNANSVTYYSPNYTTSLSTSNGAGLFANAASADSNPISPDGSTGKNHCTGPWVMSAGHKLSYSLHSSGVTMQYNFLILEEAAG